ncbi:MAG: hypothetical protein HUJ27_04180 [Rhodobacteraceae bacterium]|nr:hypothetical protein [Paracoccaceae bacterium]
MSEEQGKKILVGEQPGGAEENVNNIVEVAKTFGVSPFKQLWDIFRLRRSPTYLTDRDYYSYLLFRPELSIEEKRQFVGVRSSFNLNVKLSPPDLTQMRGFLGDKVTFLALMRHLGFGAAETQALVSNDRILGNMPVLRSVEDIVAFLENDARYPLFGKPVIGYQAVGTVGIKGKGGVRGTLELINGETAQITRMAEEIMESFSEGYMLQSLVPQHPDISEYAGMAVGTVRVVTVIEDKFPQVLYAVWKIPSRTAMSDNFWQKGSMLCAVDEKTGTVLSCRYGKGVGQKLIEDHPETGKRIVGFKLPHWDKVCELATSVHGIYPVNGCLGWDIAIGPDGPEIVECNENTGHDFYQMATGRGPLNEDLMPHFERVIARSKRLEQALLDKRKKIAAKA